MSLVEETYRAAVDAMTPAQRIERMHGLLRWVRDLYAREIVAEHGEMSAERLQWEVALRLYGSDRRTRSLIEARLRDVHS